jgi:uroporphyrinogen-III decarboxylase
MNSRERVLAALNHQQPDRVPVDFGATPVTGIHVSCVADLRRYYGLEERPVKAYEPYQMLGLIEDDLRDALGIDVVGVSSPNTMFGFKNENWKPWETPWGQTVLVSEHFHTTREPDGSQVIYPEGDTSAPPSGRMPATGFFFDTIVRQEPIQEESLDVAENLEEFGLIDDSTLAYYKDAISARKHSESAIIAGLGGLALGDIALVPAPFLKRPRGIRDIAEWYMSTAMRQDYIHQIFERQVEIGLKNLERFANAVGDSIDALFICGTDFGTQTSSFCSVRTFKGLYQPYYKTINDWIHKHTGWKTFKHSCGAVEPFVEEFINSGFDILNPVQYTAANMDPRQLKQKYGDRITFWGGGVDTQKVLPFGTPSEVRQEVLKQCDILSENGGFVFNTVHNVQAKTPIENLVAMFEGVREFNGS